MNQEEDDHEEMAEAMPEEMIDEYLDAQGHVRRFRLHEEVPGFLHAEEIRADERAGLHFVLPVRAESPIPVPWGDMRDKIRRRLAERHIVRDRQGTLHNLHNVIRGQLSEGAGEDDGTVASVVVDDLELSWEEIGRLLTPYVGWGIRIEIRDCGEE